MSKSNLWLCMILVAEIGHFALAFALVLALVQVAAAPFFGAGMSVSRLVPRAAILQCVMTALSFVVLTICYVNSDFSVVNVALNSHTDKPLLYKITGVWANHEGSMLLWALVLSIFGAGVALFVEGEERLVTRALVVQAMVGAGTLAFILFASNPFLRAFPSPAQGMGMNPLLQDPGVAFHPPFLYLGYVGLSIAFAFAIAGLLEGRIDRGWARLVRPWVMLAWTFLTIGIGLGAWWAYYELGWGGFWFWDPVENASFIPWLAATALLHSIIVVERREVLGGWTALLAILAFCFSLIGTFLVRSGVLTSVHAFAQDPTRGFFILCLLFVAFVGSLTLFAARADRLEGKGAAGGHPSFHLVSREGALLVNNLILAASCATVLIGTLYPLALELITGQKVSVGAPYFNKAVTPMLLGALALAPIGVFLSWRRARPRLVWVRLRWPGVAALAGSSLLTYAIAPIWFGAWLGVLVGIWACLGSVLSLIGPGAGPRAELSGGFSLAFWFRRAMGAPVQRWAMACAHGGVGVIALAASLGAVLQHEDVRVMKQGEEALFHGYTLRLVSVRTIKGPNWVAERAHIEASRGGSWRAELTPEKRHYPASRGDTTEAAIRTRLGGDLYIAIGEAEPDGGRIVRMFWRPGVVWLWIGASLTAFGGILSLWAMVRRRAFPAVETV